MTTYVIDASVVIKSVVTTQPLADKAIALLSPVEPDSSGPELLAPDLLYLECASALWKYVRFSGMAARAVEMHLDHIYRLPIVITTTSLLVSRALTLGLAHEMSVYDACYVALAESVGCTLVTADERLVRQASGGRAKVEWLGAL